ncbi:MAG: hypothetical protein H8E53_09500 [Planctomycetes bacterium]|nr:hypothetical protein [Planctomycetota bacterium]
MTQRKHTKLIREKDLAAEVTVDLLDSPEVWGPHLSPEDAAKLDSVRLALRNGNIFEAQKLSRVYRLTPISAA